MESKIRHAYDAALVLKPVNSAAVTATETSAKVPLNLITGSVYGSLNGRYGEHQIDVVLLISALVGTGTYSLAFTSWDASGGTAFTHETRLLTASDVSNPLTFAFKTGEIHEERGDSVGALFGYVLTVGGTSPSITYWGFVSPNPDAV